MSGLYCGIPMIICAALSSICLFHRKLCTTLGYGIGLSGIGFTLCFMGILGFIQADIQHFLLFAMVVLYGNRLSRSFLMNESKNPANRISLPVLLRNIRKENNETLAANLPYWIFSTCLLGLFSTPLMLNIISDSPTTVCGWIGLFAAIAGYSILNYGDRYLKVKPDSYTRLGEAIFWFGMFFSAMQSLQNIISWIIFIAAAILRAITIPNAPGCGYSNRFFSSK